MLFRSVPGHLARVYGFQPPLAEFIVSDPYRDIKGRVESVSCCDRYVNGLVDFALNIGPWRLGMFNAFVVATRVR